MAMKGVTLASTDFPLYAISLVGDRHVLVAGGGGSAKTGVANSIVRLTALLVTICHTEDLVNDLEYVWAVWHSG